MAASRLYSAEGSTMHSATIPVLACIDKAEIDGQMVGSSGHACFTTALVQLGGGFQAHDLYQAAELKGGNNIPEDY
ncbi:hypothetical protein MY3296_005397 [Beauveria thailandica]